MTSQPFTPDATEGRRFAIPPGAIVLGLGLLFVLVIIVGVVVSNRGEGVAISQLTIAELRADPDRWDNRVVELTGSAQDIRELPYLSQYALYIFRDDTGTIYVLTQKGAPPEDVDGALRVRGIYHSKVTLDDELKRIVEDQLGPLAGAVVNLLVPGVPLNVVFLEHQSYEVVAPTPRP
jgi:hypothetical protein